MGQIKGWKEGREAVARYGTRKAGAFWAAIVTIDNEEQEIGAPCKWRSTAYRRAEAAAKRRISRVRPLTAQERRELWEKLIGMVSDPDESQIYWGIFNRRYGGKHETLGRIS